MPEFPISLCARVHTFTHIPSHYSAQGHPWTWAHEGHRGASNSYQNRLLRRMRLTCQRDLALLPRHKSSHCPLKSVEFPRLRLCCYVTVCLCVPVRQVSALLSLLSSLYIFDTKHTTRRRAPEGNSRADGPRRIDGTAGEGALKRVTQSTVVGASSSAAATITQQPCLPARKHDRASSHAPLHSDWRSQCQQSFVI